MLHIQTMPLSPMVEESFTADVYTLRQFIGLDLKFETPKYQREFVWDKHRITTFLDDIEGTRMSGVTEIFVGSVIASSRPHPKAELIAESGLKRRKVPLTGMPSAKEIKEWTAPKTMYKLLEVLSLHHQPGATPDAPVGDLRKILLGQISNSMLIDGQQRLTTITIISKILSGWADHYALYDERDALNLIASKGRLALKTGDSEDLRLILDEHVHGGASELFAEKSKWQKVGKRGHRMTRGAYNTISSWFDKKDQEWRLDPKDSFSKFIGFFLDNLTLIFINVKDQEQENLVFLSLNSTGEMLTQGEQIKSYLFHRASLQSKGCADAVEASWAAMTSQLERISLYNQEDVVSKFLLVWARSRNLTLKPGNRTLLGMSDLYLVMKRQIESSWDTDQGLRDLAVELNRGSKSFRMIIKPPSGWNCREDMIDFRMNTFRQHVPLFMAAETKGGKSLIEEVSETYQVMFGRLIGTSTWSNKAEKMLNFDWAEYIRKYEKNRAIRKIKLDIWEFLLEHLNVKDWKTRQTRQLKRDLNKEFKKKMELEVNKAHAKYYLRKIEDVSGWTDYDPSELEAEHIFPDSQTKGKSGNFHWWTSRPRGRAWGERSEGGKWWPEEVRARKETANKLGNFLILEGVINGKAGRRTLKPNLKPKQIRSKLNVSISNRKEGDSQQRLLQHGGKWNLYRDFKWKRGTRNVYGSQLTIVKDFIKTYHTTVYWTPKRVDARTVVLARKAVKKRCWSLDDWDIDSMGEDERFDEAMDRLRGASSEGKLDDIDITGFNDARTGELEELKSERRGEIEEQGTREAVELEGRQSDQDRFASKIQELMEPGIRYEVRELIDLLGSSDFDFTENDLGTNRSEPNRPRWHRGVTNAVRNSPDRSDYQGDGWTDLKSARELDHHRNWKYWVEPGEEE